MHLLSTQSVSTVVICEYFLLTTRQVLCDHVQDEQLSGKCGNLGEFDG